MNNGNGGILHAVAWICLLIGWFTGAGILAFPVGIVTANKAKESGQDAGLIGTLNKVSFGVHLVLFILGVIFLSLL